jgi:hypothetical protein
MATVCFRQSSRIDCVLANYRNGKLQTVKGKDANPIQISTQGGPFGAGGSGRRLEPARCAFVAEWMASAESQKLADEHEPVGSSRDFRGGAVEQELKGKALLGHLEESSQHRVMDDQSL